MKKTLFFLGPIFIIASFFYLTLENWLICTSIICLLILCFLIKSKREAKRSEADRKKYDGNIGNRKISFHKKLSGKIPRVSDDKLENIGAICSYDLERLSRFSPKYISDRVNGIGEKTAQNILSEAKK
tara:strand:- start:151 stop:534 length:384 start_codon:yes stop_codon:yes gene_type:complete